MDLVLIGLLGGVGGVVATLVGVSIYHRVWRVGVTTDVDDLAVEVDRIGKLVRRLTMQRLRQDALDAPQPLPTPQPAQPLPAADIKAALRKQVFGGQR